MENLEPIILKQLIENEDYMRKVIPFLKEEYFYDPTEKNIFRCIREYVDKYNSRPTTEAVIISLNTKGTMEQDEYNTHLEYIDELGKLTTNQNIDWLSDNTEKFCKNKAIFNAIKKSISIFEEKDKNLSVNSIPDLLSTALGVSFDTNIGHDYIEQADDRFNFYHLQEDRIPFKLSMLNTITNGGTPKKTLNIILAGTNVGKSLMLCDMAADSLLQGKNVLYITLEMAEERIAERIDANLLNVSLDDMSKIDKNEFDTRITTRVAKKTTGKLIIKEYPEGTAHVGHFRHLLNELKTKKKFVPDIIYIDYLKLCLSQRLKLGSNVNTNTYIQATSEEIRGLAKEKNIPIWTATQSNRGAQSSSDVDLEDIADSFGIAQTADFIISVVETEELIQLNQYLVTQLKNRYRDKNRNKRFVIGVDKSKQRLSNVTQPTSGIIAGITEKEKEDDTPAFDKGNFGQRMGRGGKERAEGFNFNV